MCDSDDFDGCHEGCSNFTCDHNPSFLKQTPSFNLKDLFGHNRCCVGIFTTRKDPYTNEDVPDLDILPYVLTYEEAGVLIIVLREVEHKDAIILTQLSYRGR